MSAGDIQRHFYRLPEPRQRALAKAILGEQWDPEYVEDSMQDKAIANCIAELAFGSKRERRYVNDGRFVRITRDDVLFLLGWIPDEQGVSIAVFSSEDGVFDDPDLRLRLDLSPRAARRWVNGIDFVFFGPRPGN